MNNKKIILPDLATITKINGHNLGAPQPKMMMARLKIFRVKDPDNATFQWELCGPDMIPDWVRNPDVIAQLVDGMMVHDSARDPWWYRAENAGGVH